MSRSLIAVAFASLLHSGCGKAPDPVPIPQPPLQSKSDSALATLAPPPSVPAVKAQPAVKFTADEMMAENKKDDNFLVTKYAGRVVELTGEVHRGVLDSFNEPVLMLKVKTGKTEFVNCPLKAGVVPYWKALPGQIATLRATMPNGQDDNRAFAWEIVSVTGEGPAKLSLDTLAGEMQSAKTASAFNDKSRGMQFLAEGEILAVELKDDNGDQLRSITLGKPGTETKIRCLFMLMRGSKQSRALRKDICKVGVRVKVVGEYGGIDQPGLTINLDDCDLLEPQK